ncbi:5'-nucleotidase [Rhodohalobacter sp. 8-1]|uniref:5'-nucleotidase n=1 Tax=Rhodohalobacter sp. 8-1 TaxID=3131972 RepID=UPI0030EED6A2
MLRYLILGWILLMVAACGTPEKAVIDDADAPPALTLEQHAAAEDSIIAAMLNSYRGSYNEIMGVKIAEVARPISFGKPESPLGNLVADALRNRASRETRSFVNLAMIGESSFRLNLDEGKLTRGDVLEFMPYDNSLVLLKLKGESVYSLSQEIAGRGGVPVSGLRFRLEGKTARDVLVNSGIIDPEQHYWLATSSWIADGGEDFMALQKPVERVELPLSIRDLYIDYFRNQRMIAPETDGRIR